MYFSWGDDPGFMRLYVDRYARINPMFPGAIFFNVEEVHLLTEIIPRSQLSRTRFAIEWPSPLVADMFSILEKSATSCSLFEVVRRENDRVIDENAKRLMALIVPHVRRAVLISQIIDLKSAALADTLDTLSAGMFLVDALGRIVHANASGHAMVAEGKVLRAAGGRLGATDAVANAALLDSFTAAQGATRRWAARGLPCR